MKKGPDASVTNVQSRGEQFEDKITTKIWLEEPVESNAYITERAYCHGYDLHELMAKRTYSETLFLLFKGRLAEPHEATLFDALLIAFMNPGPRNNGSRAAVQAAVGKTDTLHILPIALSIFAGEQSGAKHLESAVRFFVKSHRRPVNFALAALANDDSRLQFGFGRIYDGLDALSANTLGQLLQVCPDASALQFAQDLNVLCNGRGFGLLPAGVAAAAFCELGILPKHASALYQMMAGPGMLAHGLEFVAKPRSQVPYLSDDNYEIVEDLGHE